jgi:hypothetical protein
MFKRLALAALVALGSLIFVAPGLAQNAVWRIDSEHSAARLFLASSRNPDASVNAGVAARALKMFAYSESGSEFCPRV